MKRVSFSCYVWASLRWFVWQLLNSRVLEKKATRRVRRLDGSSFDLRSPATQARIYSARLDIEEEQFERFLYGGKR